MDSTEVPAGSIVVGIDGSPWSDAALTWAADQAALEQRQLTIVHALQPISLPASSVIAGSTGIDYGQVLAEQRDAARELLTNASELALGHHPELTVNGVLSLVDPRGVILDLAETATMVVVGSRGRGPISSLLLGSVSVSVSKHAPCPVVVHRPGSADLPRRGILVGIDGSERSMPALDFAYRMASWRALPLTVLHCSWEGTPVAAFPVGTAVPASSGEQALVAESLAGMAEKFPDVEVQVTLTQGFADQHLIAASNSYDLLVIGHHPIPVIDDLVYGSVAPTVVEHAHGAVAVVPSRGPVTAIHRE